MSFLDFVGKKKFELEELEAKKHLFLTTLFSQPPSLTDNTEKMAAEGASASGTTPGERHAIGISFGNSNSSIAYTTIEDKAEVIANEDGGVLSIEIKCRWKASNVMPRPSNPDNLVIRGR